MKEHNDGAAAALQAVCGALVDTVTKGQIDEVRGQLPEGMKQLFPPPR